MATSTPELEKNISFFLSPSAANTFIVCHVDISAKYPNDLHNSYKLKLWKASEKTKTCWDLETYFGEEITRNKDFQFVCQSCFKKNKNTTENKTRKRIAVSRRKKYGRRTFFALEI